jgi:sarcosine oxidase subunit beta
MQAMSLRLLKYALNPEYAEPRFFNTPETLRDSYDVVIIGGGGHGLACAYHLAAEHGIKRVAVIEKGYLGGGNTGRNTTIIRSNYLTPEGVLFYKRSVELFQTLSDRLDLNLFFSNRGHFTLAHSEATLRTMRWRAEVNQHYGVNSELVSAADVKAACPQIDLNCGGNHPILGALYHAPGAIARHDAVAWGYARRASQMGVEIFQHTDCTGIEIESGRVVAVNTTRGRIKTGKVVSAVAGSTPTLLSRTSFHTFIARIRDLTRRSDAGPVSVPGRGEDCAPMGRHGGYDARFRACDGQDRGGRLLPRRGLGHLGLQSHSRVRRNHGLYRRARYQSPPDRSLRHGPLQASGHDG